MLYITLIYIIFYLFIWALGTYVFGLIGDLIQGQAKYGIIPLALMLFWTIACIVFWGYKLLEFLHV